VQKPIRLYDKSAGPGRYRLHVFGSSDNSESEKGDVIFEWDGSFDGLHGDRMIRRIAAAMQHYRGA